MIRGATELPEGMIYRTELISPDEEQDLVERMAELPFREFEFHGYLGKRRVVSYGWHYDFNEGGLRRTAEIPPFLLHLREAAGSFAGLQPEQLEQVLVTEYGPGAGIGWHRDKAVFDEVVGVSLLSACLFRMRCKAGDRWERVSFTAEPRSAYLLRGASRTEWEHSIAGVDALRYSVTFRSFRARRARA